MIAIRANAAPSSGIGHLARCYRLAAALRKRGFTSHFFIDRDNTFLKGYLSPFDYSCLYDGVNDFTDEESDGSLFIAALDGMHIDAVVVDDYRLSGIWEQKVHQDSIPLIVLDDRDTASHYCSMIVDGKWTGLSTWERYRNRVPQNCIKLLGPEYLLLDGPSVTGSDASKAGASGRAVSLMVSLGGGGDLTIATGLMRQILDLAPAGVDFTIQPVVGYYATNKETVLSLGERDAKVKPIVHARNLHDHLKDTTLYIGAAGGTLYEALSMHIPAITFALAENQKNELGYLEDLGHYFHLNCIDAESFNKMAELVWSMLSSLDRVQRLYSMPRKVEIDVLGTEKVAKVVDCLIRRELPHISTVLVASSSNAGRDGGPDGSGYVFELVDDRHVNRYLDARNLYLNLQNMTETQKVQRLDHYIWWLKSARVSYLLKKADKPLLYIWHQPRTIAGVTVLVGGWFVCSELCGAVDALYALNQQLLLTDKEFPGLPWVAVIKKSNQYVQSLNKRLGFEKLDQESHLYGITRQCFPSSTPDEFFYYCRQ